MKERPILFHGEMVKAILAGSKTMTRRIIKPQQSGEMPPDDGLVICNGVTEIGDNRPLWYPQNCMERSCEDGGPYWKCPYGAPGDRLWVKETFADTYQLGDYPGEKFYKATYLEDWSSHNPHPSKWKVKWEPSIFMPRRASRILLEIVNIRVERLQQITRVDALNEGITWDANTDGFSVGNKGCCFHGSDPVISFIKLWNSINADRYPWDNNPYVWVIEFRRVK